MNRGSPSPTSQSFENACRLSWARALLIARQTLGVRSWSRRDWNLGISVSMSRRAYQTSSVGIRANSRMASRYERIARRTMRVRSFLANSLSRAAISRLAERRLTSHSHGPGVVSSKSLTSKIRWRSGVPKMPKFERCASPQSWTVNPEAGVDARSAAIESAAPR